jgi:hypothetical protein
MKLSTMILSMVVILTFTCRALEYILLSSYSILDANLIKLIHNIKVLPLSQTYSQFLCLYLNR